MNEKDNKYVKHANTRLTEAMNLTYKMARLNDNDRTSQDAVRIAIALYIEAVDQGRDFSELSI